VTTDRDIVLDANVLLSAVFGRRVRQLMDKYGERAGFYSPDACLEEAQKYVPDIATRRSIDVDLAQTMLEGVCAIVEFVDRDLYREFGDEARQRIESRDPNDWPVVATALMLDLPV
jgi:predicted nucleic acid-binding protein